MGKVYLRYRLNVRERVLGDVSIPSCGSQQLSAGYAPCHSCAGANQLSFFEPCLAFMKDNSNKDKDKNLTPPRRSRVGVYLSVSKELGKSLTNFNAYFRKC